MAGKRRSSMPLLIGTVLVGALAVFIATRRAPVPEAQAELLLPALRDALDKVDEVRIIGAGNKRLVTLERAEAGFTVAERSGYRADTAALRALLLQLSEARKLEPKTARKDRYAALGVEALDAPKATGARVEIEGVGTPIAILVGRSAPQLGGGTFVRDSGAGQSWLVSESIVVEREPERWLEKRIADIAPERVQRVRVTRDGKTFVLARGAGLPQAAPDGDSDPLTPATAGTAPSGAPGTGSSPLLLEGSTLADMAPDGGAEAVAGALSELDLVDVLPASDAKPPGKGTVELLFTLGNGVAITSLAWQVDEKTRLRLSASPAAPSAADPATASGEVNDATASSDSESDASDSGADAAATESGGGASAASVKASAAIADAFNRQWNGWTFVLPPHRTRGLMPERAALLRQTEAP